jgi:hypothetical protein
VNPSPLTFWDRAQLTVLRLLSVGLGLLDRLFHVDWGERALGRMSRRWEDQLAKLDEALAHLEQEREELQAQSEALAIHAAAIFLAARNATEGTLRFDPALSHDDEILDATIEILVKQRLASIETIEVGNGEYLYTIEPDWAAILTRLRAAAEQAEPEIADWFQEGTRLIDEALLSQVELPDGQDIANPQQE